MIDTRGHMIAAYVVATTIYVLYSLSLYLRARKYRHVVGHPERSREATESRDPRAGGGAS